MNSSYNQNHFLYSTHSLQGPCAKSTSSSKAEKQLHLLKEVLLFTQTTFYSLSSFWFLTCSLFSSWLSWPISHWFSRWTFSKCIGVSLGSFPLKVVTNKHEPHECSLNGLNLPDFYFITETLHMVKKVIWANRKNFTLITNPSLT